jgi:lipoyl-dependent peroxiredoxin
MLGATKAAEKVLEGGSPPGLEKLLEQFHSPPASGPVNQNHGQVVHRESAYSARYLKGMAGSSLKYWPAALFQRTLDGMKPFISKASVVWLGSHANGNGAVSTPSEVLKKALYTLGRDIKARGTNPPELIAAAHAGSFSIALANELGNEGYTPRQIDTVTVTMEDAPAGWTMTQIHLDVIAAVPLAAQCDFIDAAMRAKLNCPISRLLNANISMRAKLRLNGDSTHRKKRNGGRAAPKRTNKKAAAKA